MCLCASSEVSRLCIIVQFHFVCVRACVRVCVRVCAHL